MGALGDVEDGDDQTGEGDGQEGGHYCAGRVRGALAARQPHPGQVHREGVGGARVNAVCV